ncbi:hypothetical protein ACFLRY_00940 [Bacteroidota bacterium]
MQQSKHNKPEFKTYHDILFGKLYPETIINEETPIKTLIETANTIEISTTDIKKEIFQYIHTLDYQRLGYRSRKHYQTKINPPTNENPSSTITIKPNTSYLNGNINIVSLTPPPCQFTTEYLKLMIDELNRIKTRAFSILDKINSQEDINYQVFKNIKIAEYLGQECQTILATLKISKAEEENQQQIYIFSTLKSFIIKSIEFYLHFFKPYLKGTLNQFNNLIADLENDYFDQLSSSQFLNELLSSSPTNTKQNHKTYITTQTNNEFKESKPTYKIIWNKNLNLLATYYLDLFENGIISFPDTSRDNENIPENIQENLNKVLRKYLTTHICNTFLDNQGEELSIETIKTYLNPNKPECRSKRSRGPNLDKYKD